MWNVLPQGLKSSSDHFLRVTDDAIKKGKLTNFIKNFDDLLLYAKNTERASKGVPGST